MSVCKDNFRSKIGYLLTWNSEDIDEDQRKVDREMDLLLSTVW